MPDLERNNSDEMLGGAKGTLSKGTQIAKKGAGAAKKAVESGALKKIGSTLIALLGPQTKMVVAIIAVIFIPFIFLISVLPTGNWFMTESEVKDTEDKVEAALEVKFDEARKAAKPDIRDFINENYPVRVSNGNIKYKGNGNFSINTKYVEVTVSLSPPLSTMKENISAYINAVNGTISACGQDTNDELEKLKNGSGEKVPQYRGQVFEKDEDGKPVVSQNVKDFLSENTDQDSYTANEDYATKVIEEADDFFTHDTETKRWDVDIHPETRYDPVYNKKGKLVGRRPYTVYCGHIDIAMYYDLSGYREEELDEAAELLAKGRDSEDFVSGVQLGTLLYNYYDNYISSYVSYATYDEETGETILGQDNRNDIFQRLLNDGTLFYVPISGLTEKFMNDYSVLESGYSGSVISSGKFNYDKATTAQIWKLVNWISRNTMYPYNCTAFAAGWFYDHYGRNELRGNGRDCAENLVNKSKWGRKHFVLSATPAPGAIFSIGAPGSGNHVGCVDAVDFENKTITISDGNTNGLGNSSTPQKATIRIKQTMTFDEFTQYAINCCAAHGDYTNSPRIVFANPIKGAFDNIEVSEEETEETDNKEDK